MPTQGHSLSAPAIQVTSPALRAHSNSSINLTQLSPAARPPSAERPPLDRSSDARDGSDTPQYPPKHAKFAELPREYTQQRWNVLQLPRLLALILAHRWFAWVGPKLTWSHLKPVIRCSIAVWIGLLLQLIRPVEEVLGYAAFFVLVVGFMVPPHLPVVQSLELFLNLYFFAGLAWAWTAIGVLIAHAVRTPTDPAKVAAAEARFADLRSNPKAFQAKIINDATYLEAKSAIVCAVFLAVGTGFFLWYKLRTQPSPATFCLVLSCILMDVAFTTGALYPNAQYTSGLLFFLPMAVQGGIAILACCLIFPESVGHSFQAKFAGVVDPLRLALETTTSLFEASLGDGPSHLDDALHTGDLVSMDQSMRKLDAWAEQSKSVRAQLLSSLAGVPPLKAQQRYLLVDISYGRLSGSDMRDIFDLLAVVQTRSGGMAFFFDVIVTNALHTHIDSSAFSVHQVNQSRPGSRAPSIRELPDSHRNSEDVPLDEDDHAHDATEHGDDSTHDSITFGSRRFHIPNFLHRRSGSPHHQQRGSHVSLLDHLRKAQQPVGVYESQIYMDVEREYTPETEQVLEQLSLLAGASLQLMEACKQSLQAVGDWLTDVNRDRLASPVPPKRGQHIATKNDTLALEEASGNLQSELDDFHTARLQVIKPYRYMFDPAQPTPENAAFRTKHYRGLFQNFVAQYHFIEFSDALVRLLRSIERLDKVRTKKRLWYPRPLTLLEHLKRSHKEKHLTDGDDGHDNDAAFDAEDSDDMLGEARKRDPEYSPWESPTLNLLSRFAAVPDILTSRSFMFATKACILSALTTLPQFIASSASFYYYNRGIWVTIMAQLTLAIYSGDTTAAWLGRVVASFWGCVLGMVAWYIGCGNGQGNPYGLGAVCAVAFPVAMFFRIHFPGPVLTAVMLPVTFGLVVGYSYLNGVFVELTDARWGFDVAWRRFLCVMIGITAAWIFSYLPPVYSRKRAIRSSYATIIGASGSLLCNILSYANSPHYNLQENVACRSSILTWRSKLAKLSARHASARLEYSLRGRWPEERYLALREILEDLLSLLAQLNHVLGQLDRPWRKALLDRTRFSDPVFLGDVLAVLTMCSSGLRAGTALPQITPAPLIERFRKGKYRGLDLPHDPSDQTGEVPSLVTAQVLESDNYMRYAVGTTTTFSIMSRLDRLVVTCKTLLGENYHVSGLHFERDLEA